MPKSGEFEDGKKRLEAQVESMTKSLDDIQVLFGADGVTEKMITEADLLAFAKRSDDRKQQLIGIRYYRRQLCEDNNPHVQEIIDLGMVPYFVDALKADDCQLLQLEAAWALTNVSAGSCADTRVVIENGALPLLVQFTSKNNVDLKEQALWALGNIAAEKSFLAALVDKGALDCVLHVLVRERGNLRLERIAIWALANFCRYGSQAIRITSDYVQRISGVLCTLMKHTDRQVLNDAAWAVASLTNQEWPSSIKELLVQEGILKDLAEIIIKTDRPSLHYPVLKACAQILAGPECYSLEFLSVEGVMPKLRKLLTTRVNRKTLSNILWLLQNIAGNSYRTASAVLQFGIVPRLVELIVFGPHEIKIEAGSILTNLFYVQDMPLKGFDALVGMDTIRALCVMLTWENIKTVKDVLTILERLLEASARVANQKHYNLSNADETYCMETESKKEKKRVRAKHQGNVSHRYNAIAQRISNAGGVNTLLLFPDHEDPEVKKKATRMISKFFECCGLYSLTSSDEDQEEMTDKQTLFEDDSSEISQEDKDEMALCEDVNACKIWESAAAMGTME